MIIGIDASRANVAEKTGTEWYSWHVIRRLPALLPGHTIRLYTREPLEPALRALCSDRVEEVVLDWKPGLLWSHLRLSWELLRRRPDALFVPADTVPIIHPRRTVTTIHDVAFERFPELYRGRSVQRRIGWLRPVVHAFVRIFTLGKYSASERDYHRWSARHALRSSATILTVSEFSRQEIIATLGARPDQIRVTPLGVEPIHGNSTMILPSNLPSAYFIFYGRLETKKNIDGLLTAYAEYHATQPAPLSLVLVGQPGLGWDEVRLQHDELFQSGAILHIPWQPTEQLRQLVKQATSFVFPSHYEGFGLPVLEAMQLGVPVICSRAGSLPEVAGPAAYYIDDKDPMTLTKALAALQSDQKLRHELIQLGQARWQSFTWDRTAEATARAIADVLALQK